MNIKSIVIAAIAIAAASAAASGQARMTAPAGLRAIRPPDVSPAERVAALESQVAQLSEQVKAMNARLDQTSKSASDANFKAGAGIVWINANGDGAVKAAQWVNTNGESITQNSTAASDKLDKILTTLTDVQHRQVIMCYGVWLSVAHVFTTFQSQELPACKGSYWNPGVVTDYLNKTIPFAY